MKHKITLAAVCIGIGALSAPAAFAAPGENNGNHSGAGNGKGKVAKECAKLKKADKAAFRALYGKRAMRTCIRRENPAGATPAELKNAAQECRAERDADADAFRETYATNSKKRNAFGKCVSTKVRADEEPPAEG